MSEQSPRLNLGRLFLNAFRWLDAAFVAEMRARGWDRVPQSSSLVFPHVLDGGIRPAEIARRAGVSRQAVNQVLRELCELDLVSMTADPDDARSKLVVLTPRGRAFDDAIGDTAAALESELARRVGAARVWELRRALEADWGPPPGAA